MRIYIYVCIIIYKYMCEYILLHKWYMNCQQEGNELDAPFCHKCHLPMNHATSQPHPHLFLGPEKKTSKSKVPKDS